MKFLSVSTGVPHFCARDAPIIASRGKILPRKVFSRQKDARMDTGIDRDARKIYFDAAVIARMHACGAANASVIAVMVAKFSPVTVFWRRVGA